jgi:hypothetical protein
MQDKRALIALKVVGKMIEAFAGIDVAFAKRKLLPISVCRWVDGRFAPLPLRKAQLTPPRGQGNASILKTKIVSSFVEATVNYLNAIEKVFNVRITRIGIDAPSDPKLPGLTRRQAEQALDARKINCITTPNANAFLMIRKKATAHLSAGGLESRIPHANQLWMLVGFELFTQLRQKWECLEVFPQATMAILNAANKHKSTAEGLATQLRAIARFTRWPEVAEVSALRPVSYGSLHDCLDAYSAAWIASLGDSGREPLGNAPNDVIWVPRLTLGPHSL